MCVFVTPLLFLMKVGPKDLEKSFSKCSQTIARYGENSMISFLAWKFLVLRPSDVCIRYFKFCKFLTPLKNKIVAAPTLLGKLFSKTSFGLTVKSY